MLIRTYETEGAAAKVHKNCQNMKPQVICVFLCFPEIPCIYHMLFGQQITYITQDIAFFLS